MEFESLCIHGGELEESNKAHVPPIYATSSFTFDSAEDCMQAFQKENDAYIYTRWGNPTIQATEEKIANLEAHNIKDTDGIPLSLKAQFFSSGMGAIATLFSSLLKSGDQVLTHGSIYGGTAELLDKVLPNQDISRITINLKLLNEVESTIKQHKNIKILYFETPANPTIDCYDIEELTKIAHNNNLVVVIDNTFSTPYLQQPFKYNVDFVIHSTTKYLNGHGTGIGGVLIGKDIEFMKGKLWTTFKLMGANIGPFDAWLVNVGINTLAIRMDKHCENAMKVAQYLQQHDAVSKVNYAGLKDHPEHEIAKKQMKDFGGMVSFELKGGLQAGIDLMNNVNLCKLAGSLGTVDTLIFHPASMTHVGVEEKIRKEYGITDGLIRLSVGIEHVNDIISDLESALGS